MRLIRVWWQRYRSWERARLIARVRKNGFEVVDPEHRRLLERVLVEAHQYVDRSGHLNTVSGRRPRAVKKLRYLLGRAAYEHISSPTDGRRAA